VKEDLGLGRHVLHEDLARCSAPQGEFSVDGDLRHHEYVRPFVICHEISFSLIYLAGAFKNMVIPDRIQRSLPGEAKS
jgi:hypothetical protein